MKKLVSIVVPVYDAEKYLEKCIYSLINQTYQELEIILVNDGSKDNSLKILKKFEKQDTRIIICDQENQGAAFARNKGKSLASGEYITFVDSDDWLNHDYIETLVNSFSKDDDIVLSGYIKRYNGKDKFFIPKLSEWMIFKYSATLGKMYKSSFLIKNNINYNKRLIMEDVEFNINCYIKNAKYKIIKYAGYIYNINSSSVTNTSKNKYEQLTYSLDLFMDIEGNRKEKISKDNFINFYIIHFIYILNMCGRKAPLDFLVSSFEKFNSFLCKIDQKWYLIKSPKNESKKHCLAIVLFKKVFKYKLTKQFIKAFIKLAS